MIFFLWGNLYYRSLLFPYRYILCTCKPVCKCILPFSLSFTNRCSQYTTFCILLFFQLICLGDCWNRRVMFICLFRAWPWHVEIPRPGIKPVPKQQSKSLQWQHHILNTLCATDLQNRRVFKSNIRKYFLAAMMIKFWNESLKLIILISALSSHHWQHICTGWGSWEASSDMEISMQGFHYEVLLESTPTEEKRRREKSRNEQKVQVAVQSQLRPHDPWGAEAGMALPSCPESGRRPGLYTSTSISLRMYVALGRVWPWTSWSRQPRQFPEKEGQQLRAPCQGHSPNGGGWWGGEGRKFFIPEGGSG